MRKNQVARRHRQVEAAAFSPVAALGKVAGAVLVGLACFSLLAFASALFGGHPAHLAAAGKALGVEMCVALGMAVLKRNKPARPKVNEARAQKFLAEVALYPKDVWTLKGLRDAVGHFSMAVNQADVDFCIQKGWIIAVEGEENGFSVTGSGREVAAQAGGCEEEEPAQDLEGVADQAVKADRGEDVEEEAGKGPKKRGAEDKGDKEEAGDVDPDASGADGDEEDRAVTDKEEDESDPEDGDPSSGRMSLGRANAAARRPDFGSFDEAKAGVVMRFSECLRNGSAEEVIVMYLRSPLPATREMILRLAASDSEIKEDLLAATAEIKDGDVSDLFEEGEGSRTQARAMIAEAGRMIKLLEAVVPAPAAKRPAPPAAAGRPPVSNNTIPRPAVRQALQVRLPAGQGENGKGASVPSGRSAGLMPLRAATVVPKDEGQGPQAVKDVPAPALVPKAPDLDEKILAEAERLMAKGNTKQAADLFAGQYEAYTKDPKASWTPQAVELAPRLMGLCLGLLWHRKAAGTFDRAVINKFSGHWDGVSRLACACVLLFDGKYEEADAQAPLALKRGVTDELIKMGHNISVVATRARWMAEMKTAAGGYRAKQVWTVTFNERLRPFLAAFLEKIFYEDLDAIPSLLRVIKLRYALGFNQARLAEELGPDVSEEQIKDLEKGVLDAGKAQVLVRRIEDVCRLAKGVLAPLEPAPLPSSKKAGKSAGSPSISGIWLVCALGILVLAWPLVFPAIKAWWGMHALAHAVTCIPPGGMRLLAHAAANAIAHLLSPALGALRCSLAGLGAGVFATAGPLAALAVTFMGFDPDRDLQAYNIARALAALNNEGRPFSTADIGEYAGCPDTVVARRFGQHPQLKIARERAKDEWCQSIRQAINLLRERGRDVTTQSMAAVIVQDIRKGKGLVRLNVERLVVWLKKEDSGIRSFVARAEEDDRDHPGKKPFLPKDWRTAHLAPGVALPAILGPAFWTCLSGRQAQAWHRFIDLPAALSAMLQNSFPLQVLVVVFVGALVGMSLGRPAYRATFRALNRFFSLDIKPGTSASAPRKDRSVPSALKMPDEMQEMARARVAASASRRRSDGAVGFGALAFPSGHKIGPATQAFRLRNRILPAHEASPEKIYVMTTSRCPFKFCRHCIAQSVLCERPNFDRSEAETLALFEELRGFEKVFLPGPGEPTAYGLDLPARPDYRKMRVSEVFLRQLRGAEACGIKEVWIFTNSWLVPENEKDAREYFSQFPRNIVWIISSGQYHEEKMSSMVGRNKDSMRQVINVMERLASDPDPLIRIAYNIELSSDEPYRSRWEVSTYYGLANKNPGRVAMFFDTPAELGSADDARLDRSITLAQAHDYKREGIGDAIYSRPPMYFITLDNDVVVSPFVAFMTRGEREQGSAGSLYSTWNSFYLGNLGTYHPKNPAWSISYFLLSDRSLYEFTPMMVKDRQMRGEFNHFMSRVFLYAHLYSAGRQDEQVLKWTEHHFMPSRFSSAIRERISWDDLEIIAEALPRAIAMYLAGDKASAQAVLSKEQDAGRRNVLVMYAYYLYLVCEDMDLGPFILDLLDGEAFAPVPEKFRPHAQNALDIINASLDLRRNIEGQKTFAAFNVLEWVEDPVPGRGSHAPVYAMDMSVESYGDRDDATGLIRRNRFGIWSYMPGVTLKGPMTRAEAAREFSDNFGLACLNLGLQPFGILEAERWKKEGAGGFYYMEEDRGCIPLFGIPEFYLAAFMFDEDYKMRRFSRLGAFAARIEKMGFRIDTGAFLNYSLGRRDSLDGEWVLLDREALTQDASMPLARDVFRSFLETEIDGWRKRCPGIPEFTTYILESFDAGYSQESVRRPVPAVADSDEAGSPSISGIWLVCALGIIMALAWPLVFPAIKAWWGMHALAHAVTCIPPGGMPIDLHTLRGCAGVMAVGVIAGFEAGVFPVQNFMAKLGPLQHLTGDARRDFIIRSSAERVAKKKRWVQENQAQIRRKENEPVMDWVIRVFYNLNIDVHEGRDMTVLEKTDTRLVTSTHNTCPVLAACRLLGLDTQEVCTGIMHEPFQALLDEMAKMLGPDVRITFERDYSSLRPLGATCIEIITVHGYLSKMPEDPRDGPLSVGQKDPADVRFVEQVRAKEQILLAWERDDALALQARTRHLQKNNAGHKTLGEEDMAEACALFGIMSQRLLGEHPFDNQIIAAKKMAEARRAVDLDSSEGKSLVIGMAAYLSALTGRKVEVHECTDYFVKRDVARYGWVLMALGLSVSAVIQSESFRLVLPSGSSAVAQLKAYSDHSDRRNKSWLNRMRKQHAYTADVIYGLSSTFIYDEMEDHLIVCKPYIQKGYSNQKILIDEESILTDGANEPLLISGVFDKKSSLTRSALERLLAFADTLKEWVDYFADPQSGSLLLTGFGEEKARAAGLDPGLCAQALMARRFFKKDIDWVKVQQDNGERLRLVSRHSGMIEETKVFPQGLHQLIEASVGCIISPNIGLLAADTYQDYYSRQDISTIGATVMASKAELEEIYKLDVVKVESRYPRVNAAGEALRKDSFLAVETLEDKNRAIWERTAQTIAAGRAAYIGTQTIDRAQQIKDHLQGLGISCAMIDGKSSPEAEAKVVSAAGRKGAVTIVTNKGGRGVHVRLEPEVVAAGGLDVIIDGDAALNLVSAIQLMNRASRQGEPGSTVLIVSKNDDISSSGVCPQDITSDGYYKFLQETGLGQFRSVRLPLIRRTFVFNKVKEFYYERREKKISKQNTTNYMADAEPLRIMDKEWRDYLLKVWEPLVKGSSLENAGYHGRLGQGFDLRRVLETAEACLLVDALRLTAGGRSRAAEYLSISWSSLRNRARKLGINPRHYKDMPVASALRHIDLPATLSEIRNKVFAVAWRMSGGNLRDTAAIININFNNVERRIQRARMSFPDMRNGASDKESKEAQRIMERMLEAFGQHHPVQLKVILESIKQHKKHNRIELRRRVAFKSETTLERRRNALLERARRLNGAPPTDTALGMCAQHLALYILADKHFEELLYKLRRDWLAQALTAIPTNVAPTPAALGLGALMITTWARNDPLFQEILNEGRRKWLESSLKNISPGTPPTYEKLGISWRDFTRFVGGDKKSNRKALYLARLNWLRALPVSLAPTMRNLMLSRGDFVAWCEENPAFKRELDSARLAWLREMISKREDITSNELNSLSDGLAASWISRDARMKQVWQAFLDSKKERRRTEATAEPALPPAETPPTASFDLWGRVFPMLKREEIALKVAPVYEETGLGVFPYLDCLVASNIGWKGWRGWIGQAGQLTGLVLSSRVASLAAAAAALVFAPQHVAVLIPPIIVANALISVSLHDNKTFRQFLARLAAELLFNFAAFSGPVALFAWMPEGPLFQNAIALFLLTLASLALAIMTHWAWNKFKLLGVSAVMGDAGDPARVIEDPLGSPLGLSSVVTESGLRPDQEAVWNAIWDDKDFCQALREARATRHLEPFRETLRFILEKGGGRAWLPLLARARFVSAPRIVQKKICSFNARNRQRVFGFGFWNQDVPVIVIVERWRLLQTMILVLMAIGRASPKECLRLIERSRYLFDVASCYAGPRSPMLAKSYKACEEIMALDRAYRRRGKKYELYAYGLLQKHSRWTTVLAELAFASSRQTLKFPSGRPSEKLPRIEKRFLNVVNCRGPCRLIWDQGIWIVYRPEMAPRDVWEGAKWKKILKENARKRGVRPVLERCRQWHIRKRRERRLNVANAQQWASLYPILVQMAQKPIPKGHEAAVRFLQEQGAVTLNNHWAIVISQRWCLPTLFYKSLVVHEAERRGQRNDYFVHYHPFARSLRLSAGDMHHVDCEQAAFHEVRGQSEGRLVGSSLGSRRQEQRSLCQKLIEFGPYMDEGLLERLRKEGGLDWKKLHNLSQLFQECCSLYEKIMKSAGAEKMWQEKGEVFWRRFFRVARLRGTGRGERPTPEKLWGQIMKALPKAIERVVDIVYGFQEEGADLVAGKRLSRRFARLVMLLRAARELSDQEVPALRQGPPQRASVLLASGPQSDDVPPRPGLHAQDRDVACSKIDYLLPAPGVNAPASPSLWLGGRGLASKADGPPAVDARAAGAGRGDEHIVANEGENEVRGQVK